MLADRRYCYPLTVTDHARSIRSATNLPPFRIAPSMHTCNHHNATAFYREEKTVRETFNAHPAYFRLHHLEGEGTSRDDLYSGIYRQSKPHAKVGVCLPTRRALPSGLHPLKASRRPAASLLLKQARPDLLPGNDFIRVALVLAQAIVQFIALAVRQGQFIRF